MSKVLLNIPDEYLEFVDEAAEQQHRSRSEMIREAIRKIYYHPKRTPAEQARIEKLGRELDKLRKSWKEPFNSVEIIRKMRDSR